MGDGQRAGSRSSRRRIFPLADFGMDSTNSTMRIFLYEATCSATKSMISSADASAPALRTTNAFGSGQPKVKRSCDMPSHKENAPFGDFLGLAAAEDKIAQDVGADVAFRVELALRWDISPEDAALARNTRSDQHFLGGGHAAQQGVDLVEFAYQGHDLSCDLIVD